MSCKDLNITHFDLNAQGLVSLLHTEKICKEVVSFETANIYLKIDIICTLKQMLSVDCLILRSTCEQVKSQTGK